MNDMLTTMLLKLFMREGENTVKCKLYFRRNLAVGNGWRLAQNVRRKLVMSTGLVSTSLYVRSINTHTFRCMQILATVFIGK
jgi:hypothetical protein